jgi:3,4-dihydroxy 2-butanone 4-phosphate synthase / GTP cyclohydrolase II
MSTNTADKISCFASIPELLSDLRAGKMVILADDEDRENEGDLIMIAELVTPSDINFMARYARGLICLGLTQARCEKLGLRPMVSSNESPYQTAFTISIEASEGVTTGISAFDRAHTIRTAVSKQASAADLRQPGHVFPLMAQPGGVLTRAGHTEASSDLAALAGFEPAAVLVEIMAEDGSMARRPELEIFARQHKLKMGTIADLIRYRLETEQTIEAQDVQEVQTDFGAFQLHQFRDRISRSTHYALVKGAIDPARPSLVRVHVADWQTDLLSVHSERRSLRAALAKIAEHGSGIAVVLRAEAEDKQAQGHAMPAWRTHGLGAQILSALGAKKLHVLGTPRRFSALSGFGIEVLDYVSFEVKVAQHAPPI